MRGYPFFVTRFLGLDSRLMRLLGPSFLVMRSDLLVLVLLLLLEDIAADAGRGRLSCSNGRCGTNG